MIRSRSADGLTYQVVVYAGRDGHTGKERYERRTVHGETRAAALGAAEDVERRLKIQVSDGQLQGSNVTLGALLDDWLELAAPSLSPTTVAGYRGYIKLHIKPKLGAITLSKLTTGRLDRHYVELRDKALAPATVRQVHAIIRRSLGQAVRWGWIATNPAAVEGTAPKVPKRRRTLPPISDSRRIIAAALTSDDHDLGILVALAASLGARRGEVCGLRWSAVDLDAGAVSIHETLVEVDQVLITKATKTDEARTVAIGPLTVKLLKAHHRRCLERALAVGVHLAPDAYLAASSVDGLAPIRPMVVTQWFRRLTVKADVKLRFHDLRHASATELLEAGVPMGTVSQRLGHRDQSTTANIYSHPTTAADRRAADLADVLFLGAGKKRRKRQTG